MTPPPTDDLTSRLEAATKRRNAVEAEVRKAEGRLEAARAALESLRAECRAKGVDPDNIDEAVRVLSERATTLVTTLETDIARAEAALAPYLKE